MLGWIGSSGSMQRALRSRWLSAESTWEARLHILVVSLIQNGQANTASWRSAHVDKRITTLVCV